MGLAESRGKLSGSMRDLAALWADTKLHWDDTNAEEFEKTFLLPLEMDLRTTASAMDQMSAVLVRVRHDCE